MIHDAREVVLARVKDALARSTLTPDTLARRAGLHPRTVRRFLKGAHFNLQTAAAIARELRVDLGSDSPAATRGDSVSPRVHKGVGELSPVVGWKAAAVALGVSRGHLLNIRRSTGCTRKAWWPTRQAVLDWFEGLAITGW